MVELTDAAGGALVDSDGTVMSVLLWGVPAAADYATIAEASALEPGPLLVRLDLSGLTGDPDEATALAEALRAAGRDVELAVAPGGRVARTLAGRGTRLRLVDDAA